jgi:S-adenosylmethionine uptake transporter
LIQVCIFRAFTATDASSLAPFRYVELVFSVLAGLLFFGEFPATVVFIGAAIIIGSTLHMSLAEFKKQKR